MGNGLKKACGLGEPSKKEAAKLRTGQGKEFDNAFRAALKRLNGHLEVTAIRADEGRHNDFAEKRERACSAYHAAVKKVDPTDPAVAQESLDQVLKAIEGLEASAENLRDYAETHYTAWVAKEPRFDAAADQVMEMVNWGHPKGAAIQQVVGAINEQVNLRKYQDAVEALDQFVIKLAPIFTEFTAQADAKIGYEAMLAEKQLTLDDFKAAKFTTFGEWQAEIQGNLDAIQQTADGLDFVTAFAELEPELLAVDEFLAEAATLQASKDAYETARAELQTRLDKTAGWDVMGVDETIARLKLAMETAAADEDFVGALAKLNELSPEVDLKLKLIDKSVYEAAARTHLATFTDADAVVAALVGNEADFYPLKTAKVSYTASKKALDDLVAAEKWTEASAKLSDATAAAQFMIDQRGRYDRCMAELALMMTDFNYIRDLNKNSPPNSKWNAEMKIYDSFNLGFNNGRFDEAIKDLRRLKPMMADLRAKVAASDSEAIPKCDAVTNEIRALANGANLTSLSRGDLLALVAKLEALPDKKLLQLLEDLHKPSTPLTAEQRVMQSALYSVMRPDAEFVNAEVKIRQQYLSEISSDAEATQTISNWAGADANGSPLVDRATKEKFLRKILAAQSKAYGIDVPEIEWITTVGIDGVFTPSTGRMQLNENLLSDPDPDKIIRAIIHENVHNFQDELVKKLMSGQLKKSHPMYEQARMLSITYGNDAYIDMHQGRQQYEFQPREMHAHAVGNEGAATL